MGDSSTGQGTVGGLDTTIGIGHEGLLDVAKVDSAVGNSDASNIGLITNGVELVGFKLGIEIGEATGKFVDRIEEENDGILLIWTGMIVGLKLGTEVIGLRVFTVDLVEGIRVGMEVGNCLGRRLFVGWIVGNTLGWFVGILGITVGL